MISTDDALRLAILSMTDSDTMFEAAEKLFVRVQEQGNKIEQMEKALQPFANMDREGCDLDEVACTRGTASDMTVLTSTDFRNAQRVLAGEACLPYKKED